MWIIQRRALAEKRSGAQSAKSQGEKAARQRKDKERKALSSPENPIIWKSFSEITIAPAFVSRFFSLSDANKSEVGSVDGRSMEGNLTYANVERHVPRPVVAQSFRSFRTAFG